MENEEVEEGELEEQDFDIMGMWGVDSWVDVIEKEVKKEEEVKEEVKEEEVEEEVKEEETKQEELKQEQPKEEQLKEEINSIPESKPIPITEQAVEEVMNSIQPKLEHEIFYYWPILPKEHCQRWEVGNAVMYSFKPFII